MSRAALTAAQAETPWCDCKVAFGIEDTTKFERWLDRTDWGRGLLPDGWELNGYDGSGARMVAIFRVECAPVHADGMAVLRLLAKSAGGYRVPRITSRTALAATDAPSQKGSK